MKIEIKSYWSGEVLYAYGCEQNTSLKSLQAAMKCPENLYGADLRGADLCGADLRGADLCGANLRDGS